jgi:transposase
VPRARKSAVAGLSPTSKNVAALFMRREEKLNGMVRNLEGEKLDGWLEEAEACGAPAMRRFATGLRKDLPAVRAGLTEPLSNGPVEGFVHKLKLLKRQGYGRAGFELLKARMLAA